MNSLSLPLVLFDMFLPNYKSLFFMNAFPSEKRYPTSMAFWHQTDWHTNLPLFQGARADHVRDENWRCCFLGELLTELIKSSLQTRWSWKLNFSFSCGWEKILSRKLKSWHHRNSLAEVSLNTKPNWAVAGCVFKFHRRSADRAFVRRDTTFSNQRKLPDA